MAVMLFWVLVFILISTHSKQFLNSLYLCIYATHIRGLWVEIYFVVTGVLWRTQTGNLAVLFAPELLLTSQSRATIRTRENTASVGVRTKGQDLFLFLSFMLVLASQLSADIIYWLPMNLHGACQAHLWFHKSDILIISNIVAFHSHFLGIEFLPVIKK